MIIGIFFLAALCGLCQGARTKNLRTTFVTEIDGSRVQTHRVVASDDFSAVAFVIEENGKKAVNYKGLTHPFYDAILDVVLSSNGASIAYIGVIDRSKEKWRSVLVKDGRKVSNSQNVEAFAMSADGKSLAFACMVGEGRKVVYHNGRKVGQFSGGVLGRGALQLSPDSKRLAFLSHGPSAYSDFMVVDGKPGPSFTAQYRFVWSPDSRHYLYTAMEGDLRSGHQAVVIDDGKRTLSFTNIRVSPLFGSASTEHIFVDEESRYSGPLIRGESDFHYKGMFFGLAFNRAHGVDAVITVDTKRGGFFTLFKGREYGPFARVGNLTLAISHDGNDVAYGAMKALGTGRVYRNGDPIGSEFEEFVEKSVAFSPNDRSVCYIAGRPGKFRAGIDGQLGEEFDSAFSNEEVLSNDQSGGGIPEKRCVVWANETTIRYCAVRDKRLYIVEDAVSAE